MKQILLTILRDKTTSMPQFRAAAESLSHILAYETAAHLPAQTREVATPFTTTQGMISYPDIIIVPILRAGLSMMPSFLTVYPQARLGFIGLRRDERTAEPHCYYERLPSIKPHDFIIILDPTIATGGSACAALDSITKQHDSSRILFANILCATPGRQRLQERYPHVTLITAHEDPALNNNFFIIPGLGDFGDRYCGTKEL